MFTLTWITEKELERVIENKGDEFRRKKNMEIQIRSAAATIGRHVSYFLKRVTRNSN